MIEGPLLSCENHLKIVTNTHSHFKINIASLYIEQVEVICEKARSSFLDVTQCCGNKIRIKSKDLQHMHFKKAKYGKVVTMCPRLRTFQLERMKVLKRLVLDSTVLSKVILGKCVVKSLTCGTNIMPQSSRSPSCC